VGLDSRGCQLRIVGYLKYAAGSTVQRFGLICKANG